MFAFLIALVIVLADRLSKDLVVRYLKPIQDYPIWQNVFHLTYAQNTGASFSMFRGRTIFLIIFTGILAIGLCIVIFKNRKTLPKMALISLGLILGGAVGNLIDRISLGYVIDFLYFKLINFAIFNVADSCVCIGAVLLGIWLLFFQKPSDHDHSHALAKHASRTTTGPASDSGRE